MDNTTGVNCAHAAGAGDETSPLRDMTVPTLVLAPFLAVLAVPVVVLAMAARAFGDKALDRFLDVAVRPYGALMWLVFGALYALVPKVGLAAGRPAGGGGIRLEASKSHNRNPANTRLGCGPLQRIGHTRPAGRRRDRSGEAG